MHLGKMDIFRSLQLHQAAELSRYFLVEGQKISNRLIYVIESIYKANSGFKEIL